MVTSEHIKVFITTAVMCSCCNLQFEANSSCASINLTLNSIGANFAPGDMFALPGSFPSRCKSRAHNPISTCQPESKHTQMFRVSTGVCVRFVPTPTPQQLRPNNKKRTSRSCPRFTRLFLLGTTPLMPSRNYNFRHAFYTAVARSLGASRQPSCRPPFSPASSPYPCSTCMFLRMYLRHIMYSSV